MLKSRLMARPSCSHLLQTHERGNDLPHGDPAVVGRDALMPVGTESFPGQQEGHPLGQIPVLEAAARKGDLGMSNPPRHSDDDLGQRVVELGGN